MKGVDEDINKILSGISNDFYGDTILEDIQEEYRLPKSAFTREPSHISNDEEIDLTDIKLSHQNFPEFDSMTDQLKKHFTIIQNQVIILLAYDMSRCK